MQRPSKQTSIIAACFVVLIVLVAWIGTYYWHRGSATGKTAFPATEPAPHLAPRLPPPVKASSTETLLTEEETVALGTVRGGDGVTRIFQRHLIAEPKYFGFAGDPSDASAVKKWAGWYAARIAIENHLIDWQLGAEVRLKDPGTTAYILRKDDKGGIRVERILLKNAPAGNVVLEQVSQKTDEGSMLAKEFNSRTGHVLQSDQYIFAGRT